MFGTGRMRSLYCSLNERVFFSGLFCFFFITKMP